MFEKLKQIKQLKELQNKLNKEEIIVEKNGVRIIINGKMEVKEVKLNPNLSFKEQEKLIRDCFNDAIKKLQISIAKEMFFK
ncbi:YbaB/EbfC family nucleoid-associated protein [bacterium]|nr:YbaB/EbfC family nucleoid-associated protein [bacterium]